MTTPVGYCWSAWRGQAGRFLGGGGAQSGILHSILEDPSTGQGSYSLWILVFRFHPRKSALRGDLSFNRGGGSRACPSVLRLLQLDGRGSEGF